MGKIAKGVNKINFTMMYGNYCYIFIENLPQKFSPCTVAYYDPRFDKRRKKYLISYLISILIKESPLIRHISG